MRFLWLFAFACACAGTSREVEAVLASHKSSDRYIEAPRTLGQRPWELGQWTLYKISTSGHVGYIKHSIVGEGRCGFWLETVVVLSDYEDRSVIRACLRDMPDPKVDIWEQARLLGAYRWRRAERTEELDFRDGQNPKQRDEALRVLQGFAMFAWRSTADDRRNELQTRAGQFAGVVRIPARMWIDDRQHAVDIWFHPDVPLGGMIKALAIDDDDQPVMETELLDYGLTGATTEW